jgi:hypothetical protein
MGRHFTTLFVSQGETFLNFDLVEYMTKAAEWASGPASSILASRVNKVKRLH